MAASIFFFRLLVGRGNAVIGLQKDSWDQWDAIFQCSVCNARAGCRHASFLLAEAIPHWPVVVGTYRHRAIEAHAGDQIVELEGIPNRCHWFGLPAK